MLNFLGQTSKGVISHWAWNGGCFTLALQWLAALRFNENVLVRAELSFDKEPMAFLLCNIRKAHDRSFCGKPWGLSHIQFLSSTVHSSFPSEPLSLSVLPSLFFVSGLIYSYKNVSSWGKGLCCFTLLYPQFLVHSIWYIMGE